MTMFYIMCLSLSIFLLIMPHPVSMMIIILAQTTLACLMIWILTKSSWFSFILFLIFLGGLMVLFVYITSLASNEKFELNNFLDKKIISSLILLILTFLSVSFFQKNLMDSSNFLFIKILMLFSSNLILPTLTIMTYLFLVLLIVVKISSMLEGPMRNFI